MVSLLLITEKRNGDIKSGKFAVGSKQTTYNGYNKRNGSYPKVKTDCVFLTGVIDAHDHRAA